MTGRLGRFASLAAVTILLCAGPASGQAINALTPQEKADGWQLLFDGKTLNGWHSQPPPQGRGGRGRGGAPQSGTPGQVGIPKPCAGKSGEGAVPPGGSHWEVVDGLLIACGEPTGYLTSDRSYRNFVLSIDFRCSEDANSGVFVRSPLENGGYEVQIWKQQPAGYNTRGIVGTARTARDFAIKPDQWNHFQITADGDRIIVVLNGETTLDIRDAKFPDGHIRLQYQQFPIAFRNVKIRPLP